MSCLGSDGSLCTDANGEDSRPPWTILTPGPDTVLASATSATYTVVWTPVPGSLMRLLYRGASSGQMVLDLVDAGTGTWTSPIVNLADDQILLSRLEDPNAKQQTVWSHLDVAPTPGAVTHNSILVTHNDEAVTHEQ